MKKLNVLLRAKQYCETKKYRFTQPRERVLSVLKHSSTPMGAYQILESLSSNKEKINPPTVYRAIEFWIQHGFIHKIQSMNTYMICCEHQHHENFCIFVCDDCHMVVELKMNHLPMPIITDMTNKHWIMASSNTEIHGTCNQCR